MEINDVVSLVISIIALFTSGLLAYGANKRSDQAIIVARQAAKFDAVMHFTERFLDLLKSGNGTDTGYSINKRIVSDQAWAEQFWSLHATEFYFFHNQILPVSIYSLWIVELAELYASHDGEMIWQSHSRYLDIYSREYSAMCDFYTNIFQLSESHATQGEKNQSITHFVRAWLKDNPVNLLDD